MSISRFPSALSSLADAVGTVASTLRGIQSASGDLEIIQLDLCAQQMRAAKVAAIRLLSEAQKARAAAVEQQMSDMGGPATLADLQQGLSQINSALTAWDDRQASAFLAMGPGWQMVTVTRDGVSTRHLEPIRFISAAVADPLRQSSELAALIAAFEAIGA